MESWWRGTSQSTGHSADIQSAFVLHGRLRKLPEVLTCPPIGVHPVPPEEGNEVLQRSTEGTQLRAVGRGSHSSLQSPRGFHPAVAGVRGLR